MSELVYHKRIKKQHNTLATKERYQRKRMRRSLKAILPSPEELLRKIDMQFVGDKMFVDGEMVKEYRKPMQLDSTGNNDEGMEVELVNENTITIDGDTVTIDSTPKEQVTKPVKFNWFEKTLRKLFSKK